MSRLEEVEASIKWIMSAGMTGGAITPNMRDLCRTLAAEVDALRAEADPDALTICYMQGRVAGDRLARDAYETVTKLLAMLKPDPALIDAAQVDIGADWELQIVGRTYDRACEIAGRTE